MSLGYGIGIPSVTHVVVHDPASNEEYVHRIGRTARGNFGKGHALVFYEYYNSNITSNFGNNNNWYWIIVDSWSICTDS